MKRGTPYWILSDEELEAIAAMYLGHAQDQPMSYESIGRFLGDSGKTLPSILKKRFNWFKSRTMAEAEMVRWNSPNKKVTDAAGNVLCSGCGRITDRPKSLGRRCFRCLAEKSRAKNYGMDIKVQRMLWTVQKGRCGIVGCKTKIRYSGNRGGAYLDHDHVSGKPRGFVCPHHNALLKAYFPTRPPVAVIRYHAQHLPQDIVNYVLNPPGNLLRTIK